MLGQDVGFPVPEGGAGMLATALRRRAESLGVQVRCGVPVTEVHVSGGRARGVRLADGDVVRARHAVLADVPGADALPRPRRRRATCPPGSSTTCAGSTGTTPPSRSTGPSTHPSRGRRRSARGPARCTSASTTTASSTSPPTCPWAGCRATPFMLLGQMTTADPTRSPAGTESVWAYTHLPRRLAGDDGRGAPAGRADGGGRRAGGARVPATAVRAARCRRPRDLEDADGSLSRGALNAGTAALHQQLVLRPTRGLGRPETPVPGPVPRRRLGPPRRRGARRVRVERRGLRAAAPRPAAAWCAGRWCAPPGRGCCATPPPEPARLGLGAQVVARAASLEHPTPRCGGQSSLPASHSRWRPSAM